MTPNRIDRFQILRELGQGAMGRVYLAYDPQIHRQVALKTIAPDASQPAEAGREARDRYLREAQAAGRLLHPNIVTVFDVGEDQGLSFIAMEYVEGETLDIYTRPGCLLPLDRILNVARQACDALEYAHAHNVVHRDVKPANLMLMSGDQLKITDFGLARQPSATARQDGLVMGTPYYMSPEQIAGKPVDGRSDLFSLGIVLYQLLTGERPFPGESVSTIAYRILYEKPRAPKIVNEKLPVHFNAVLDRALAKDPAERFQTGAEFRRSLDAYRDSQLGVPGGVTLPGAPAPRPPVPPPRPAAPAPRPPVPPRPARRPAPRPQALLAGRPGKISFLGVTLAATVLLFPRSFGTEPGRWEAAGFGIPGPGGPAPVAPPPLADLRVWVATNPPGASLALDGEPLEGSTFTLSPGDDQEHRLVGSAGCLRAEQAIRVADRPEAVTLELQPEILALEVVSRPEGAAIVVDGQAAGRVTPARIDLDWCRSHQVRLEKEGYYPWERSIAAEEERDRIRAALGGADLAKIPNGYLRIPSPEGYAVEILQEGRRIGASGEQITLPEGTYRFLLRSERHFVEKAVEVKVVGRKVTEPKLDLPGLGFLTILALPSNCKIYVGDRFLDIPPVVDYPIGAGEYTIRTEYIPTGEIREERVRIEPGRQHRITFRFEP
ncbi:MAG: serine/threonine protein kinase [Acidobacteria bacterium]|nr:serine/threonine protein kinase [Acidobacteriota bacterium]